MNVLTTQSHEIHLGNDGTAIKLRYISGTRQTTITVLGPNGLSTAKVSLAELAEAIAKLQSIISKEGP